MSLNARQRAALRDRIARELLAEEHHEGVAKLKAQWERDERARVEVECARSMRWAPWRERNGYFDGERFQERLDINGGRTRVMLLAGSDFVDGRVTQRETIDLGDEAAVLADHLRQGGWHIQSFSSGLPPGRPTRGATNADFIRQRLEEMLGQPVADVVRVAGLGKRGGKNEEQQTAYDGLARAVAQLTGAQIRPVNRRALAGVLDCSASTVDRLAVHLTQNVPKRGGSMQATDEQIALDVERLTEIAAETVTIAARLQAQFPTTRILAGVVDRFIGAALDPEQQAA